MNEDDAIAWFLAAAAEPQAVVLETASAIFARSLQGEPLDSTTPDEITDLARKAIRAAVMLAVILYPPP